MRTGGDSDGQQTARMEAQEQSLESKLGTLEKPGSVAVRAQHGVRLGSEGGATLGLGLGTSFERQRGTVCGL